MYAPIDLKTIEARIGFAVKSQKFKSRVKTKSQEEWKEAEEELSRAINSLEGKASEKMFTAKEREEMAKLNPDYIKELAKHPEELKEVLKRYRKSGNKVVEIYSPPRIVNHAENHGLSAGWSLDLSTVDPFDGLPWDFTSAAKRRRAEQLVRDTKPYLLAGGPPCTDFCVMQNMNWPKMSPEERKRRMIEARLHLDFCAKLL